MPGTTSCFCPISGIQKESITSAAVISNTMLRCTGIDQLVRLRDPSAPDTRSAMRTAARRPSHAAGSGPALAFCERTIGGDDPDRDDQNGGHGRPGRCRAPCARGSVGRHSVVLRLGGERRSPSTGSRRRPARGWPMQITVANQKVNVMRSISSDADVGSQGIRTATGRDQDCCDDPDRDHAHNGSPANHRGRAYQHARRRKRRTTQVPASARKGLLPRRGGDAERARTGCRENGGRYPSGAARGRCSSVGRAGDS